MNRPGILALCLLLAACGGQTRQAPVEERAGVYRDTRPVNYTVKRGDTLYSIAWRYGLDYRELAQLYPGQTLRLRGSVPPAAPQSDRPVARAPAVKAPPEKTPAAVARAPEPVTNSSSPPVKTDSTSAPTAAVDTWRWPTSGKVVRKFSGTVHKGVDIDGRAGDAVQATAAGRVVYAGSGIVGYGKLLIVKHNEVYLSAYGHNRKLLVAEGDNVTAGQKIAEKGSSATNSVKLHFEIRRGGKPVDPLSLLPRR